MGTGVTPTALHGRLDRHVDANFGTWRGWVRLQLAQAEFMIGRLDRWLMPNPRPVDRLVFVCLGNINRSAFAAAVARRAGASVVSIGLSTSTGAPATPAAIAGARRHGVDLSTHRATDITDYEWRSGDLLLAMEVRHASALAARGFADRDIALLGYWASPSRLHLHDPHTLSDAYFVTCFALIESAVRNLLVDLAPRSTGGAPCLPSGVPA
jgi:protein-tyrosine phosphatase